MATYRWPSTGRHRPVDAVQHAACLKTDFDSVSHVANVSLSNTARLPSGLQSRISMGITKGIAEARSNGFCPKWSEVDKSIFSKVMLKNITNEAALEARDCIPLPQFDGLHESYSALHSKLITPIPPTATTTHQSVGAGAGAGAGAATEATSVIDLVKAAQKSSKEVDGARTLSGNLTNRREEDIQDGNDEESGEDTDEEDEDEMDESEDAEKDHEETGNGDSMSGDDSSEEGSSDDGSSNEDGSETDSDTGGEEVGDRDVVGKGSVVPYMRKDGRGFSTTITLKIEQQASVNRLEEMKDLKLSSCLTKALKNVLNKQQLSFRTVELSDIKLLDNGDLRFAMHAETREAFQRIFDSTEWGQQVEKALGFWRVQTYKVRMHTMNTNILQFQTRKEKATIIRRLAGENRAICQGNDKPIIRNIHWPQQSLPKVESSLILEFLDPEQATRALDLGLCWQGRRHGCERADGYRIDRCTKCQGYGHRRQTCSAPNRCGKCAGQHGTRTCKSTTVGCASCGGAHHAGHKKYPAKVKARKSLVFKATTASQAIGPTADAQATAPTLIRNSISAARTQTETSMPSPVSMDANSAEDEVKSEPDRPLPQVDPTHDENPDIATLLEKIEELSRENEKIRKIVVAWDGALQTESSGRTKRRAGEAFAGGAEAESSSMTTKRIKHEEPTRQGSMGLYRQPSPFILDRPQ